MCPWLHSLAEVSHQWRETCLGSLGCPYQTRPNSSLKHSLNYRPREAGRIFIRRGLGIFLSLDISEPFLFFYNSFGMYWLSKITTWESSGHGNERQEQFTTSLTNLLNMFLWQILIFSTVYLCYRLKTLVVCHFRALALWMNHGNKKNFVNYHLCQYCFSSKDRSMWFRC